MQKHIVIPPLLIAMRNIRLLIIVFLVGFFPIQESNAFWGTASKVAWAPLSKKLATLPNDEITKFSEMIKGAGDITIVKRIIGEKNLSKEVLEDTYTRIAIHRGSISSRAEAESMYMNLHGVEGFGSTMGKIIGVNPAGTIGHLNELRIANAAASRGFKVEGIGIKYADGIKKADTDLDVLVSKNGYKFPIEAKDYPDVKFNELSNTMRPDMDSLVAFRQMSAAPEKVHPIFTLTNIPSNPDVFKTLESDASKRGIELIIGTPEQQLIQIEALIKTAGSNMKCNA